MAVSAEVTHRKTRIVSVVAATAISLACGTNYAYSAWAPQFAEKLQLTATQSNIIGTCGNLGMYLSGIPMGMITDRKSPRLAVAIGMASLLVGYFPIHMAYDGGPGSMSVALISLCSFMTGVGSCAAFSGALKTAALNWPTHRGTATAFPLSAFGLSAFFYTLISGLAFPGNTSDLLLFFSLGTSLLVLASIPFLNVVDAHTTSAYTALPASSRNRRDSNLLHRTKSNSSKRSASSVAEPEPIDGDEQDRCSDESSSLLSAPGDIVDGPNDTSSLKSHRSHSLDVTGLGLIYRIDFWQLWIIMGLLTGVGLMTINNIGHDVQALWNHYDSSASKDFVAHRQLWHVSIISLCNFAGRLLSGITSDLIAKRLGMSRFWCVIASATVFMLGQICAIRIENPNFLWAVSGFSGLAYGILFGVLPALVADAFGSQGFAMNWGIMTLAAVVSGNVYNLFYGSVYDAHSTMQEGGEMMCEEGLVCYQAAYYVTLTSTIFGILACFWGIRYEHITKRREEQEDERYHDA